MGYLMASMGLGLLTQKITIIEAFAINKKLFMYVIIPCNVDGMMVWAF